MSYADVLSGNLNSNINLEKQKTSFTRMLFQTIRSEREKAKTKFPQDGSKSQTILANQGPQLKDTLQTYSSFFRHSVIECKGGLH